MLNPLGGVWGRSRIGRGSSKHAFELPALSSSGELAATRAVADLLMNPPNQSMPDRPEGENHPNCEHDTIAQRPTQIGAGTPKSPPQPDAHLANQTPTPGAQPPEETGRAQLREPHRVAAGWLALTESLRFTIRETGLTRGVGDWLKVNKKDGFDCQSCAWPSPDDDRHLFEFCENGVKALTSEATRKKITPEFFREHSIADLQQQSDYWLELQGRLVHPMVKRARRDALRADRVGRGVRSCWRGN